MDHNAANDIRQAVLDGAKLIAASNLLLADAIMANATEDQKKIFGASKDRLLGHFKNLKPSTKNPIS